MVEEATEEVKIPLYYDRFQEERDKRITSELGRLETMIGHNAERIADLHAEMNRRFEEAKADRDRRFEELEAEMDRRFGEAKADRDNRFGEAKADRDNRFEELKAEMDRRFEEAKTEMDRRFGEAKADRDELRRQLARLEDKVDAHFRWTMGLLLPIIFGILAIIIRVFFLGPLP